MALTSSDSLFLAKVAAAPNEYHDYNSKAPATRPPPLASAPVFFSILKFTLTPRGMGDVFLKPTEAYKAACTS